MEAYFCDLKNIFGSVLSTVLPSSPVIVGVVVVSFSSCGEESLLSWFTFSVEASISSVPLEEVIFTGLILICLLPNLYPHSLLRAP